MEYLNEGVWDVKLVMTGSTVDRPVEMEKKAHMTAVTLEQKHKQKRQRWRAKDECGLKWWDRGERISVDP